MTLRERTDLEPLDPLPADFINAEQEFLGAMSTNFLVRIKPGDATVLQVPASADNGRVVIGVEGRWRWIEANVERASLGGSARTMDVYVTAAESVYTPGTPGETDDTDRSFALSIQEVAAVPSGVDVNRLVAKAIWNGTAFTAVDMLTGPGMATARHAATHATSGSDPIAPGDIGAATAAALTAETTARIADVDAEETARIAADANNPSAGEKAAMAGSSGAPAGGNRFVTELDPRISGLAGSSNVVFVAAVGDGSASVFAIDHNLGTRSLEVQVRQSNSPFAVVDPDIEFTTINQVTVRFTPTVPASGEYTVTIMAPGTAIQAVFPSGIMMPFAGPAAPAGWLLCDGASYLRATYAALFAALGGASSPYGLPDGTHFNVPDLRDRVPVGKSGTIALGASGGEKTHVLLPAEAALREHQHKMVAYALSSTAPPITTGGGTIPDSVEASLTHGVGGADRVVNMSPDGPAGSGAFGVGGLDGGPQNGAAHNNMQPYLGLSYLVKI